MLVKVFDRTRLIGYRYVTILRHIASPSSIACLIVAGAACAGRSTAVPVAPPAEPLPVVDSTPPLPDHYKIVWEPTQFALAASVVTREPDATTPQDSIRSEIRIDLHTTDTLVQLRTIDSIPAEILSLQINQEDSVPELRLQASSIGQPCLSEPTPLRSPLILRLLLPPTVVNGVARDTLRYSHCLTGEPVPRTVYYTWTAKDSLISVVIESAFDIDSSRHVPTRARGTLFGTATLRRASTTHAVQSLDFVIRTQLLGQTVRNGARIVQSIQQEIRGTGSARTDSTANR